MKLRATTHADLLAAFGRARSIALGAYTLAPQGSVARALEAAAERGGRVSVTLDGAPAGDRSGGVARANRAAAETLRAHGVTVRLAGLNQLRLHLKAALVDGACFLDDRNWPGDGRDTIVETGARGVRAAVAAALAGRPSAGRGFATEKARALALEAATVRGAHTDRIDVETETFGSSALSRALRTRARRGERVRLIVSAEAFAHATPRERSAVRQLARAGVHVRLGGAGEKLCVAGDRGWVGSANADVAPAPMLDWGACTRDRALLGAFARSFARDWREASPLPRRTAEPYL